MNERRSRDPVPSDLPPIMTGGRRLPDRDVAEVLAVLQAGPIESPRPLCAALKRSATAESLDAFARHLCEKWVRLKPPPVRIWPMFALGHLGSDAMVPRLATAIGNWAARNQGLLVAVGLDCLRTIGSVNALFYMGVLARLLGGQGFRNKANYLFDAAAREVGLTRGQLQDRVLPPCGLARPGGEGALVFDFGSRRFSPVLGPDLRPRVREAAGAVLDDLPPPGPDDDHGRAAAAVAGWQCLRRRIDDAIAFDCGRLEEAMVAGRRWTVPEFEARLVRHPLTTHLARLLVWAGYAADGTLATTFRVTEELSYCGVDDATLSLGGMHRVGIPHPVELGGGLLGAWGDLLSDYEMFPPFDQIGRTVYLPDAGEMRANHLTRFAGAVLAAPALGSRLEGDGWSQAPSHGAGTFGYCKRFPESGVTVVVECTRCFEARMTGCYFTRGIGHGSGGDERIPLSGVPPVAFSEAVKTLAEVIAQAGEET